MVRTLIAFLLAGVGVAAPMTYGQSLFSGRSMALGAYAPLVEDTRGFTDNPAGLVNMRDWDFSVATYVPAVHQGQGFVFQGIALGKRFFDNAAIALQYSQSSLLEFVIPTSFTRIDSTPVSVDKRISYDAPFAAAMAYRLFPGFSAGISTRLIRQKLSDSQYLLVIDSASSAFRPLPDKISSTDVWRFDLAIHWKVEDRLALSLVGRNIARLETGAIPPELESYALTERTLLDVAASWRVAPSIITTASYSTGHTGGAGVEWMPAKDFALRTGVYLGGQPFVSGVGVGVGYQYKILTADIGYLKFTSQEHRTGSSLVRQFDPSSINSLDLHQYASDRVQLSLKLMFGSVRPALATLERVEIADGIYPSAYELLAYRPFGKALVKNVSDQPIEARVRFYMEKYMDVPTESQPVYILPGETRDVPLTAVFNDHMKKVDRAVIGEGNVFVSATPAEEYDDKYALPVMIRGRNAWDGDVATLRYFVTPDDPAIVRYTRDVLLARRDSVRDEGTALETYRKAVVLINAFAGKLIYVSDPTSSADIVQYPAETLQLRGGDCDDMTACFSSLLNSIGISTAFVDVIPLGDSLKSHIYLMFDTGVKPEFGNSISTNAKRYIVRKNRRGEESVWIPIETTVISHGFDAAWSQGSQEYFDDVEVGLGLAKGWVRIVDVN
jgi:hypothetical protein